MDRTRIIGLAFALLVIGGSIYALESKKPHHAANTTAVDAVAAGPAVHSADYAAHAAQFPKAKELVAPDGYINTDGKPIALSSLIGKKVILLDFWTYSCINCQRTLPYLTAWYGKYKDAGLVIIGVHTPEFDFEKQQSNVETAVRKFGITYPVVLDNEYATWDAYRNNFWPEEYLIDIDGLVREHNIGEGNYAKTEQNIQKLLAERQQTLGISGIIPSGIAAVTPQAVQAASPETYFNWSRNQLLGNGKKNTPGVQTFTLPANAPLAPNTLYLKGTWDIETDFAKNTTTDAGITYKYSAQDVYFVASAPAGATVTVLRDGVPVSAQRGEDVDTSGTLHVQEPRLYKLIHESAPGTHTLQLIVHTAGLEAFTFTFG